MAINLMQVKVLTETNAQEGVTYTLNLGFMPTLLFWTLYRCTQRRSDYSISLEYTRRYTDLKEARINKAKVR